MSDCLLAIILLPVALVAYLCRQRGPALYRNGDRLVSIEGRRA